MKLACLVLLAVTLSFELHAQSSLFYPIKLKLNNTLPVPKDGYDYLLNQNESNSKSINRNSLTIGVGDVKVLKNGNNALLFSLSLFINHIDNFYVKYGTDIFNIQDENEKVLHYSLNVIPSFRFDLFERKFDIFWGFGFTVHGAETNFQNNMAIGLISCLSLHYNIFKKFGAGIDFQIPHYIFSNGGISPFLLVSVNLVLR